MNTASSVRPPVMTPLMALAKLFLHLLSLVGWLFLYGGLIAALRSVGMGRDVAFFAAAIASLVLLFLFSLVRHTYYRSRRP